MLFSVRRVIHLGGDQANSDNRSVRSAENQAVGTLVLIPGISGSLGWQDLQIKQIRFLAGGWNFWIHGSSMEAKEAFFDCHGKH